MFKISPLYPEDLFNCDMVNLDTMTENFTLGYYLYYFKNHSEDCLKMTTNSTPSLVTICGYLLGKLTLKDDICSHISAITVSTEYRGCGIGRSLISILEWTGDIFGALYSDLYVRATNHPAVDFYLKLDYQVYRRILDYYTEPVEDAYDMRKALKRDKKKESVIRGEDIHVDDLKD